jgi:hypothetical protein
MFSTGPPRDYISSTEQNRIREKRDRERTRIRMERGLGSQGGRVRLKIDCD